MLSARAPTFQTHPSVTNHRVIRESTSRDAARARPSRRPRAARSPDRLESPPLRPRIAPDPRRDARPIETTPTASSTRVESRTFAFASRLIRVDRLLESLFALTRLASRTKTHRVRTRRADGRTRGRARGRATPRLGSRARVCGARVARCARGVGGRIRRGGNAVWEYFDAVMGVSEGEYETSAWARARPRVRAPLARARRRGVARDRVARPARSRSPSRVRARPNASRRAGTLSLGVHSVHARAR